MFESKILKLKTVSIGLGTLSITFSLVLMFTPVVNGWMLDGGAGLICPNGERIDCDGYRCSTTATSCTCRDRRGVVVSQKTCPD